MSTLTTNDEEVAYELLQSTKEGKRKVARGVLETTRMLERRKASTVIFAANVMPLDRLSVIRDLCDQQGVRILMVSDKKRLGKAAGLEVGASCVAVSKDNRLK